MAGIAVHDRPRGVCGRVVRTGLERFGNQGGEVVEPGDRQEYVDAEPAQESGVSGGFVGDDSDRSDPLVPQPGEHLGVETAEGG